MHIFLHYIQYIEQKSVRLNAVMYFYHLSLLDEWVRRCSYHTLEVQSEQSVSPEEVITKLISILKKGLIYFCVHVYAQFC